MNTSFLDRLLERTADWHTRLGQNMLSVNLLSPSVTLDDYRKNLFALFGFIEGFEKYIFPELTQFIPDLEQRRKTQIIKNDLVKLGQNINELETMPENYFRSMYTDPYAALGALYVLESSTLGGELIQKHLQDALKDPTVSKLKYFVAQGENADAMWKKFLNTFSALAEKSGKEENIIDGALRTLRLLDLVMTEESVKV
ncbi:MAG: Heme oxygenase-like protein [Sediminibacterium sp.]|nr:Heme oxygenase-like protein [Sediminibacterium sp.]